jgi:SAM-dependent methyltransferase
MLCRSVRERCGQIAVGRVVPSGRYQAYRSPRVFFRQGDAECLPFADRSFDAIVCECAFCTFPNKQAAANEFARVLRKGGRVGLSDLTRIGALAPELDGLLSRISCIADAQPIATYAALLSGADLEVGVTEEHDSELIDLVSQMRLRLLAADVMVGLKKIALPGFDFEAAREVAKHALQAIKEGRLGYAIVTASKATYDKTVRRQLIAGSARGAVLARR